MVQYLQYKLLDMITQYNLSMIIDEERRDS